MTLLLLCLVAAIVLLTAICVAVRYCNLERVDIYANIWQLAVFSFSVKSRHPPLREKRGRRNKPGR